MIVYLDSNVYISAKYNFNNTNLGTLKNLVEDNNVTILYTSATIGEIQQHIRNDIGAAVTKYNRVLRNDMPIIYENDIYDVKELDKEKVIGDVIDKFNKFINNNFVEKIPLNPIDAEVLMDDYFKQNPPFDSKKPNEFKDAIMINAIKIFQQKVGIKICIVSNDNGFRKAFTEDDKFITFKYLSEFLKHYTQSKEILAPIADVIADEASTGMFDDIIKDYIRGFDIDRGYYAEWRIEDADIDDINCELLYIEKMEYSYIVKLSIDVDMSIDIIYRDENTSYYDKEEDSYLIEHFINSIEHHKVIINVAIECQIEQNEEIISVISANVLDDTRHKYINLDENTMYDSEEIENSLHEEPDLEYCSECGGLLGRTLTGAYVDIDNNPLCEKCMNSNDKGEVCPMCGRKVPHEYMMSGFCKDCEPKSY